jgi:hypothetical protein
MRPLPGAASPQLTIELERASLRALGRTYDDLNASMFKNRLQRPTLLFVDREQLLGQWCSDPRRIELSRGLLLKHGWGTLVEVLKHEMAHQFVQEVMGVDEANPHGEHFRRVCDERGIDRAAAGMPGSAIPASEQERVLDRVAKLLSLAQSSNLHEAETAMSVAQRLMLKYNLDHATDPAARGYRFVHLGQPTGRIDESGRILAAILAEHFFVEVIWVPVWRPLEAKRGSVLEVCGTAENVELASYVHAYMLETGQRLWQNYRRERKLASNSERRAYIAGVMAGFRDKLAKDQRIQQRQGLVWVGDAELARYLKRRHPYVRWTRAFGHTRSEAWSCGREAGKQITLHRPVKAGPSHAPKLLPGR